MEKQIMSVENFQYLSSMNGIFLYVGWAKMPSNITQATCNWSCYRNLKVLKISQEGFFGHWNILLWIYVLGSFHM